MVCFGASKILMGTTSELGPIDPQILSNNEGGMLSGFSVVNIVESYKRLFRQALRTKRANLEPYLQQLGRYDAREMAEFEQAIKLSQDIAVRYLAAGMMQGKTNTQITKQISVFLDPKLTLTHGRAIYRDEAKSCGIIIDDADKRKNEWDLIYELYIRANALVSSESASKLIESKNHSFLASV